MDCSPIRVPFRVPFDKGAILFWGLTKHPYFRELPMSKSASPVHSPGGRARQVAGTHVRHVRDAEDRKAMPWASQFSLNSKQP